MILLLLKKKKPSKKPYLYISIYKQIQCMSMEKLQELWKHNCRLLGSSVTRGGRQVRNTDTAKSGSNVHTVQSKRKIRRTPKHYTFPHFTQVSFQMGHPLKDPSRTSYLATTSTLCLILTPYLALQLFIYLQQRHITYSFIYCLFPTKMQTP